MQYLIMSTTQAPTMTETQYYQAKRARMIAQLGRVIAENKSEAVKCAIECNVKFLDLAFNQLSENERNAPMWDGDGA